MSTESATNGIGFGQAIQELETILQRIEGAPVVDRGRQPEGAPGVGEVEAIEADAGLGQEGRSAGSGGPKRPACLARTSEPVSTPVPSSCSTAAPTA